MSSWGCPHEVDGVCLRVKGASCHPGMLGCVVQGKVERLGEPRGARRFERAKKAAARDAGSGREPEERAR
jgi:hypothetical protein